ncbi:hypothetical protein Taro_020899 [Colocasia esculenta]|uniref:Uncharacterized protein n=1 Tax=Colocasia esculenta TaxID=4460 RepID=A0A843UZZ6_COLES|nr:hypothetical protein [Colocasia esculenta]
MHRPVEEEAILLCFFVSQLSGSQQEQGETEVGDDRVPMDSYHLYFWPDPLSDIQAQVALQRSERLRDHVRYRNTVKKTVGALFFWPTEGREVEAPNLHLLREAASPTRPSYFLRHSRVLRWPGTSLRIPGFMPVDHPVEEEAILLCFFVSHLTGSQQEQGEMEISKHKLRFKDRNAHATLSVTDIQAQVVLQRSERSRDLERYRNTVKKTVELSSFGRPKDEKSRPPISIRYARQLHRCDHHTSLGTGVNEVNHHSFIATEGSATFVRLRRTSPTVTGIPNADVAPHVERNGVYQIHEPRKGPYLALARKCWHFLHERSGIVRTLFGAFLAQVEAKVIIAYLPVGQSSAQMARIFPQNTRISKHKLRFKDRNAHSTLSFIGPLLIDKTGLMNIRLS